MYAKIRLYDAGQKQVALSVKIVWFSYRRDFLTLAICSMEQKLAGIILSWGIVRYAYISCGKVKLRPIFGKTSLP